MEEKTRILIVDDETINLDFFEVMLGNLGFEVERAEDGEEALECVKSFQPHLMLLDNIMPKLSGWEVTRILKNEEEYSDWRDVPIIMFSAMDDVKDKVEGFELGVDDYITKPFNFLEVLARIRAVLRNRTLSSHVLAKERHIAQIESLNQSLIYFTQHLRGPVMALKERSEAVDVDAAPEIRELVDLVKKETSEALATLEGLQEEIRDLERAAEERRNLELTLSDLERKFQKHFRNLKAVEVQKKGAAT